MPPTLGQLKPGTKCDRYDIVRLIGSGGMGEVYMALHEFTKKPVAIKVLKIAHATNQRLIDKMRAEAMVLCRIRHENLVEVYDAGITDTSMIWMAMELMEGESLRERMVRERAVRPALALEWAAQAADGVQAAHDADIIHRDLKPENVFLKKSGTISVLDFGTAKFGAFQSPRTETADRMGTIPYMSPEHLNGDELDGRSDVFALGMILYEMLVGKHAFANQDGSFPPVEQMLGMMLAGEPEPLDGLIGAHAWGMLQRALSQTLDQRYASMTEFAAALRAAIPHLPESLTSGMQRVTGTSGMHARPAVVGQITPAPVALPPQPQTGVGRGAVAAMSFLAAALGAASVFIAQPSGTSADNADDGNGNNSVQLGSAEPTSPASHAAAQNTSANKTANLAEPSATPTPSATTSSSTGPTVATAKVPVRRAAPPVRIAPVGQPAVAQPPKVVPPKLPDEPF